jgi:hypothetical protein
MLKWTIRRRVVGQQDEHEQHSAGEVGTVKKSIETVDAT